jgi:hypothetical protein
MKARLGAAQAIATGNGDSIESGSLVAEATNVLGGLGFFLRADRSIWTFVDAWPLSLAPPCLIATVDSLLTAPS